MMNSQDWMTQTLDTIIRYTLLTPQFATQWRGAEQSLMGATAATAFCSVGIPSMYFTGNSSGPRLQSVRVLIGSPGKVFYVGKLHVCGQGFCSNTAVALHPAACRELPLKQSCWGQEVAAKHQNGMFLPGSRSRLECQRGPEIIWDHPHMLHLLSSSPHSAFIWPWPPSCWQLVLLQRHISEHVNDCCYVTCPSTSGWNCTVWTLQLTLLSKCGTLCGKQNDPGGATRSDTVCHCLHCSLLLPSSPVCSTTSVSSYMTSGRYSTSLCLLWTNHSEQAAIHP